MSRFRPSKPPLWQRLVPWRTSAAGRGWAGSQWDAACSTRALQRMALAARHGRDGLAVIDARQHIEWVNDLLGDWLALPPARLRGRSLGRLGPALGLERESSARFDQAVAAGRCHGLVLRRRDPDGALHHCLFELHPVPGPGGRSDGAVATFHDISERVAEREQSLAWLAAMPHGVVLRDREGRGTDCNPAAERLLMAPRERLLGRDPADTGLRLVGTDLRPIPPSELPSMLALAGRRRVRDATIGVVAEDGRLRWLQVDAELLCDEQGEVTGVVSCYADVTEQRHQQAVLAHTVAAAGLGTWRWDLGTGHLEVNDRLLTMLGHAPQDLAPTMDAWSALVHPDDRRRWQQALRQHLANPALPCRAEVRVRRHDGQWAAVQTCGLVIAREADGRPREMAGINIDLTEQTQMQALLRHAARTDSLTQLPNRAAVFEHVQQVIDRAAREPGFGFAVLFMDFDRFKQVNDTLGHSVGDELLRQVATRLCTALHDGALLPGVPGGQHTAGRIGGDEFVVVLEGVRGREAAEAATRRLTTLLAEPYELGSSRVHSSASVGIVTAELAAGDAYTVMRDADTAMYEAKRRGRGCWAVFDPGMHERVAQSLALEHDLRRALEHDELFVVFQPVLPLATPGPVGLEALVRWRHPQRGLVPPALFIGVAEESGLILAVGRLVLEQACRQFMAWRAALGPARAPGALSVNLSVVQLQSPALVDEVRQCLADTGMPPDALQLEVTESLAAQDESARARLRELKAMGLRIALDDFGTGYSSLACLHQLPVDTVKIDRSFVVHAETSEYHRVLIEATIRVARALGMGTVAEGIETDSQAALLRSLRCDRGQGYVFSRPLAAGAVVPWLLQRLGAADPAPPAATVAVAARAV